MNIILIIAGAIFIGLLIVLSGVRLNVIEDRNYRDMLLNPVYWEIRKREHPISRIKLEKRKCRGKRCRRIKKKFFSR